MGTTAPTVPTTPAGQLVTSGQMQSIEGAVKFLLNPPRCQAIQTTVQAIAPNTWVPVAFDTESYDTSGMHSTTSNNSRLTCQVAGRYLFCLEGILTSSPSSDNFAMNLWINGSLVDGGSINTTGFGSFGTTLSIVQSEYMNVGDYAEMILRQNSSGSINTLSSGTGNRCCISALWIASS